MATQTPPRTSLSESLTPIILGGAAWSHQIHPDVYNRPIIPVLLKAFSLGITTIDTSPYYAPSEEILGAALSSPLITSKYTRADYTLMTKVGRIASEEFCYEAGWVRQSVERSLQRFQTSYLDVVFCHDIEYVTTEDALTALSVLWDLVGEGKIRYVGVSGYPVDTLLRVTEAARERFGKPLDVVQCWGQLTLQNLRLKGGLGKFGEVGVGCVCGSSPLNIGLLREGGVPVGSLGNWHPAPEPMRAAAAEAAAFVKAKGDGLANVALRFAIREAAHTSKGMPVISTIIGPGTVEEVEDCAKAAFAVRKGGQGILQQRFEIDEGKEVEDSEVVEGVRSILGEWIDYCFESPPRGWSVETKKMVKE